MPRSETLATATKRGARRKLTAGDYRALGEFRHALRRFLAFSESGAQALGLTPQQHQALLAVRAHPGPQPMTVGELAARLMVKNHSALGLVERLVERGLLVREASQEDRRRVLLRLSETGERKLEAISRNNIGQLRDTLPAFTELMRSLEQFDLPPPPAEAAGKARTKRKT